MEKVKLLKFVTCFAVGGTERHVVNLVRNLNPSRFEIHLACLRRRGEFLQQIDLDRIPLTEYKINRLYNLKTLCQHFRFARYLRRNRIQVVQSYGFYATTFALPAARLARVPVTIASIRDMGDIWTPTQRRVQKMACTFAKCVLTNADAISRRLIQDGYDPGKIVAIPNGVQIPDDFPPAQSTRVRRELGIPVDAPLVVLPSRLNPLKGIEYFIDAAALSGRCFPEAYFLVVGDTGACSPSYRQRLQERAIRLGMSERLIFTGFRLDLAEIYAEASIAVLPSLSEGLSNVLLEAMAAGLPVIATRVGGNEEVVEGNVTGLLVPPANRERLAQAIIQLLQHPELATTFGRAGRERVIQHFSMEKAVRETEELYLRLVGGCSKALPSVPATPARRALTSARRAKPAVKRVE